MKRIIYRNKSVFIYDEYKKEYIEMLDYDMVIETINNNKKIIKRNRIINKIINIS